MAGRAAGEKVLIALAAFTGVTGLAGGILLMIRPNGTLLQMTPAALAALSRNSPFPDFLVPGLLLALVVGCGMLASAALVLLRKHFACEAAVLAGAALVVFEVVELGAIGFMPLQLFEALVGIAVSILAVRRRSAIPAPCIQAAVKPRAE